MYRYAVETHDHELLIKIALVRLFKERLPRIIDQIRENSVKSPDQARIILTTTHKAKGLEFDHVRLSADFEKLTVLRRPQ